jgi:hypothetical protein
MSRQPSRRLVAESVGPARPRPSTAAHTHSIAGQPATIAESLGIPVRKHDYGTSRGPGAARS